MMKFQKLYEILLETGVAEAHGVLRPDPIDLVQLRQAHTEEYVTGVCQRTLDARSVRRIGLPLETTLVRRSRVAVGGTLLAARTALAMGAAFNTAGGSHHAFSGYGSGYCVFNDVAVAVKVLLDEGAISRALIIDLDVHQGDGTAEILDGVPGAFTFSMHCEENFPRDKRRSGHDVALRAGTGDEEYLSILESRLRLLLPRVSPTLVVYNAGVDPHVDDRLGKLALSDAGLEARERLVVGSCIRSGVPIAGVVGGGYDANAEVVARRHAVLPTIAASLV